MFRFCFCSFFKILSKFSDFVNLLSEIMFTGVEVFCWYHYTDMLVSISLWLTFCLKLLRGESLEKSYECLCMVQRNQMRSIHHTEKNFLNLVNPNQIWIVIYAFQLICAPNTIPFGSAMNMMRKKIRKHSEKIPEIFIKNSGKMQEKFRKHSEKIQDQFLEYIQRSGVQASERLALLGIRTGQLGITLKPQGIPRNPRRPPKTPGTH